MGIPETIFVVMALAVAIVLLWFANPPAPVRIDSRGILDRRLGLGCIRWDEIEGAWQPRDGNGRRVQLRVRVTERLSRLLRRRSTAPLPAAVEVPVDLCGTHLTGVEVLHEIVAHSSDAPARRA